MQLNADFTQPVLIHSEDLDWLASPMAGVERRMLDRIGDEVARATTIVRYAPGSAFSAHTHTGGEEFIVLSGVFQDEHGDYPTGTYVRNPPTSAHTPSSGQGCVIFVKLWQFDMADRTQFRRDMAADLHANPAMDGTVILHQDSRETVRYSALTPDAQVSMTDQGGIEVLVLEGTLDTSEGTLKSGSWLRLPHGTDLQGIAGDTGVKFWSKAGHLPFAKAPVL